MTAEPDCPDGDVPCQDGMISTCYDFFRERCRWEKVGKSRIISGKFQHINISIYQHEK